MYLHLRMTSSAIFSGSDRSSSVFSLKRRTCKARARRVVRSFKMHNYSYFSHCPPRLTRGGPCASSGSFSPSRRGGASCVWPGAAPLLLAGLPVRTSAPVKYHVAVGVLRRRSARAARARRVRRWRGGAAPKVGCCAHASPTAWDAPRRCRMHYAACDWTPARTPVPTGVDGVAARCHAPGAPAAH